MNIDPRITRIDLERIGYGLVDIRQWYAGWAEGQAPDVDQVELGRIEDFLSEYEKQGFACWMADSTHGRALRGKTTRVDFTIQDGKHLLKKYCEGWSAKTPPISVSEKTPAEWESSIAWCESHGWTVFRWIEGARAYKGKPMPIHDAITLRRIRRKVNQDPHDPRRNYDLAFCW